MSERPILFSAPMIRAILAGRKTQTRRIVKPQPATWRTEGLAWPTKEGGLVQVGGTIMMERCPYGVPGDRLWVREAFCVGYELEPGHFTAIPHRGCEDRRRAFYRATDDDPPDESKRPWKPSIHMPRWASRITLEITDVRVERVQDISQRDCIAEGIERHGDRLWKGGPHAECGSKVFETPRPAFQSLWDSINAKRAPWAVNPWVWCVSFRPTPAAGRGR